MAAEHSAGASDQQPVGECGGMSILLSPLKLSRARRVGDLAGLIWDRHPGQ
jgi:hypothetical protein